MKYNPLENLNEPDIIKLVSFGDVAKGNYGNYYPDCTIEAGGSTMSWQLSEDKRRQFESAGFKEGDTVKIEKWREGTKRGYNFKAPDGKNPYKQDVETEITTPKPDNKELSIVSQSILHIPGYYIQGEPFKAQALQAIEDAKWFLEQI